MPADLERSVPAEIRELPGLLNALVDFLEGEGVRGRDLIPFQVAVDEAFSNIVLHGDRGAEGNITLRCRRSGEEVEVVLEDRSPRFDPMTLPPPDVGSDLAHRRPGGLGITLMRHFMDGVSYEYRDGKNVLTLNKRLRGGRERD